MQVYHEILPESYLLILADNTESSEEQALAHALRQASRSGKPYVWVDCSRVHQLPQPAITLLLKHYEQLRQRHTPLVLCNLDERLQPLFRQLPAQSCPPMVANLADADHYCHSQA